MYICVYVCVYICACRELWDGPRAGADDAVEFTGVDEVRYHMTWEYCNLSFLNSQAFTLDHLSDHLEHK